MNRHINLFIFDRWQSGIRSWPKTEIRQSRMAPDSIQRFWVALVGTDDLTDRKGPQQGGLLWLVYTLTGSALKVTVVGLIQTVPPLLFGPMISVFTASACWRLRCSPLRWLLLSAAAQR